MGVNTDQQQERVLLLDTGAPRQGSVTQVLRQPLTPAPSPGMLHETQHHAPQCPWRNGYAAGLDLGLGSSFNPSFRQR